MDAREPLTPTGDLGVGRHWQRHVVAVAAGVGVGCSVAWETQVGRAAGPWSSCWFLYRRTQGQPLAFFLGALGGLGGSSCSWYFLWEELGEFGAPGVGERRQGGGSTHRTARTSCSKASSTLRRSLAEASK